MNRKDSANVPLAVNAGRMQLTKVKEDLWLRRKPLKNTRAFLGHPLSSVSGSKESIPRDKSVERDAGPALANI